MTSLEIISLALAVFGAMSLTAQGTANEGASVKQAEKHRSKSLADFHKDNFYFAVGTTDTIYLAKDKVPAKEFEALGEEMNSYQMFQNKEDLFHFLNDQYMQGGEFATGYSEKIHEYEIQVNQKKAAYYSKRPVSIADYNDFCTAKGKPLPYFPKDKRLSSPVNFTGKYLFLNDLGEYCVYLSESWGIPVRPFETVKEYGYYRVTITETDWKRKEFLDKINGYMTQAYGKNSPVYFGYHKVYSMPDSFAWTDIKNMAVDRNKRQATIRTYSGEEITFGFTEEQYTHIASVHVHFLAFYKIMLDLG